MIRKYYGITPDGGSLVGIYLWESVAAANVFYTPDWVAMVNKRWAGPPQRQEWETPMHLQPLPTVEPSQLLVVHDDAFASEQDMQPPIAEPPANGSQLAESGPYRCIVRPAAAIAD